MKSQKNTLLLTSTLKSLQSFLPKLVTNQPRMLSRAFGSTTEAQTFNGGKEYLHEAYTWDPSIEPKHMFDEFYAIEQIMSNLAESNKDYKDTEFSPDPAKFTKIDQTAISTLLRRNRHLARLRQIQ